MKISIQGNIHSYYLQTLSMLFFPGVKFSETDEDGLAVDVKLEERENADGVRGIRAVVSLTDGDKTVTRAHFEPFNPDEKISTERISCGKAFIKAGKALTGIVPSWGILTGVRPAKLALNGLNAGQTKSEIKKALTREYLILPKKATLVTDIAVTEKKIISQIGERTCSMYISIPFCPSRCSYCSFVSFTSAKLLSLLDDYLNQLCEEIRKTTAMIAELGLTVSTVYIGGGTPTTLDAVQLNRLLDTIAERIDVSALEEFTVEAGRPDTITREKLEVIKNHGVTRISINPQTLNDDVLELIGRKHTVADFYRAFELARTVGIPQINTDLIAGLPGEGFGSFSETIDAMVRLRPENLTFHTLCFKNAADFSQSRKSISGEICSETAKCVDYSQLTAKNAGYVPYYIYRQKNTVDNLENVGFALPGTEGRYNIYMMEEVHSIFAVGAGAVSKMVSRDGKIIKRIFEYKYPYEYLSEKDAAKNDEKMQAIWTFYREKY